MKGRTRSDLTSELVAHVSLDAAERLPGILTRDDVETLRVSAKRAASASTLRAVAFDLGHLEAWHAGATDGDELTLPTDDALALRFVSHHLFLAEEREKDARHGMPAPSSPAHR